MRETFPNINNATLEEIHTAMHASPTKKGYIRLNAMFFLLQDTEKEKVAKASLVDIRTLNRWINLFNEDGIDGLIYEKRPGRPPIIHDEETQDIISYLENPQKADRDHWTLISLHGYLKEEIDLQCSYSTLVRKVHKEGYSYTFPRPKPTKQDEERREQYKENLSGWITGGYQIWYLDETGIEGDPRPRRRWSKKGEKHTVPYSGTHIRENVIGAVCPATGRIEALQVNYCNSDMFQIFLDQLSKVVEKEKVILIMDNASWHKSKQLNWRGMRHEYLPPYSPDFNPIERLWLILKSRYFTDWIAKTPDELSDRITYAMKQMMNTEIEVKSICRA